MRLRIMIIAFVISIIFIFPQRVKAEYVFYYEGDGLDALVNEEIEVKNESLSYKIYFLVNILLNSEKNVVKYIGEGARLNSVSVYEDEAVIDISEGIRNYGGSYYELRLLNQLAMIAFQFEQIKKLTILTDGKSECFPQGSEVYKWQRKDFGDYEN